MFYFLLAPLMTYNFVLIAAAVIPAVFLMIKVFRSDRLERESPSLLMRLVVMGVLSSLLALVEEWILEAVLGLLVRQTSTLYNILLYFVVVAVSEESSKYLLLKRSTWRSPEFNCQYDGVVYAVFVSLGFALWENISYVMNYGFSTALVRAVTAMPNVTIICATIPPQKPFAFSRYWSPYFCTALTTTSPPCRHPQATGILSVLLP